MNRLVTVLLAAAAAAGALRGAERAAPLAVPLPPLARVTASGADGLGWRQSGEVGGSVASARGDFVMALGAQGWTLNKTIVLGRAPHGSELMIWSLRKRRILFMVWEIEAGTCGFAWGEEK